MFCDKIDYSLDYFDLSIKACEIVILRNKNHTARKATPTEAKFLQSIFREFFKHDIIGRIIWLYEGMDDFNTNHILDSISSMVEHNFSYLNGYATLTYPMQLYLNFLLQQKHTDSKIDEQKRFVYIPPKILGGKGKKVFTND